MSSMEHDVPAFWMQYGEALSAGDIKMIVASWKASALVIAVEGARPGDTVGDVEQFFAAADPNPARQRLSLLI